MMQLLHFDINKDTTFHLQETLEIERYRCGVVKLHGELISNTPKRQTLYLCSDLCQDSHVNESKMRALRQFVLFGNGQVDPQIDLPIWLPVVRRSITSIRMYICDTQGEILSFQGEGLHCTLVLIP